VNTIKADTATIVVAAGSTRRQAMLPISITSDAIATTPSERCGWEPASTIAPAVNTAAAARSTQTSSIRPIRATEVPTMPTSAR
jgi:hypothetical protein